MKRQFIYILLLSFSITVKAQDIQYQPNDSIKIEQWLKQGSQQKENQNMMLYFARLLKGIPYVAKTLEVNSTEKLIINTRELDCTTYVENVLALYLCHKNKQTRFANFCTYLRLIRYHNGEVSYGKRLHYFTEWIVDNVRMGYLRPVAVNQPPFTAKQFVNLHFMTSNTHLYPMMHHRPEVKKAIREMEKQVSGKSYLYIPKDSILNTPLLRSAIHDGDIIAMLTRKKGLDTSHVGIAVWHSDGLHLLNASSIRGKVVEEPKTLYQYMQGQRTQIGIRAVRCNGM